MTDTLRDEFARAVIGAQPPAAYKAAWAAEISAQSTTGEVTVRLDDAIDRPAAGYANVPAWFGIPGVFAQVPPGSRCKVSFDGASAAGVYVSGWDQRSSLSMLQIGVNDIAFQGVEIGGGAPARKSVVLEQPLMSMVAAFYAFDASLQERIDLLDTVVVPQLSNDQQVQYAAFKAATEAARAILDQLAPLIGLPNTLGGSVSDKLRSQ